MQQPTNLTFLNAKNATGIDRVHSVAGLRHIGVYVATTGMGAGDTIKIYCAGSMAPTQPTFTTAKSSANPWDYVQMVDFEDGSTVDGDTGVTFTDANDVRQFRINVDNLNYLTFIVDTISDTANTSITVKGMAISEAE